MTRNDDHSPRPPGRDAERKPETDDAPKERLFSFGDDAGEVPLAAVFKTRRRRGRRREDGASPSTLPPVASPPGQRPVSGADLDVIDVVGGEFAEQSPEESFDVLLTDDFRVAEPASPPPRPLVPEHHGPRIADVIPPDADPVWAREAVLSLAEERMAERRRNSDGAWYHEVFSSDYLKVEPPHGDAPLRTEVDLIESSLALPAGGRVLDLGCGYGRHTVPLARRGYEMVGLDLSLDLLQNALRRAQAKGASIKFVHGDMRDLGFDGVFDGAFSFNTAFGYFSEPENLMVLRGVHKALKPGGRFLIDITNRDHAIADLPTRNWWEGDSCLIQEDVDFDHLTSRLMIKRFLVFSDGTQREYDIALRLYSPHELLAMLRLVGFRFVELSGSLHYKGAFFGALSDRIIMTVEK